MIIRRFKNEDAIELANVIAKTLRTTNIKDYSPEYIENDIRFLTAEKLIERSNWTNLYVVCDDNVLIGCGAIGPYWGKDKGRCPAGAEGLSIPQSASLTAPFAQGSLS